MKLNKKVLKIFEDINFQIDGNDEVSLNRTSVKNQTNQKIVFYANQEVYKDLIKKNKFEDCLFLWQETKAKYLVQSNDELKEIVKKVNELGLYTLNLNWLDTVNITNMYYLFKDAKSFNQPIGNWDVSNVKSLYGMFQYANSFNQDINKWDVSNVKSMDYMFFNAKSFNQPIGDWDVSNVKDMNSMFCGAETFNQPIGDWDVSNVEEMAYMFYCAESFNQDISNWDVSNVESMINIFDYCPIKEEYKPKFK